MSLDELRSRVAFHNTIDVWIALCLESGRDWNSAERYREFIQGLREKKVPLKAYPLCVSDAESENAFERDKAEFAASLADDPDHTTYTVRLSDSVVSTIRGLYCV